MICTADRKEGERTTDLGDFRPLTKTSICQLLLMDVDGRETKVVYDFVFEPSRVQIEIQTSALMYTPKFES